MKYWYVSVKVHGVTMQKQPFVASVKSFVVKYARVNYNGMYSWHYVAPFLAFHLSDRTDSAQNRRWVTQNKTHKKTATNVLFKCD